MSIAYHYTTIDTLEKMLWHYSPKSQTLRFRGTHFRYLNDFAEFILGTPILSKCVAQIEAELNVPEQYRLGSLLSEQGYSQYIQRRILESSCISEMDSYLISFSENKDNISMWYTYGNRGDGIALGFNPEKLLKISSNYENVFFRKCTYWNEETLKDFTINSDSDEYRSVREYYRLICQKAVYEALEILYKLKGEITAFERTGIDLHPRIIDTVIMNLSNIVGCNQKVSAWEYEREHRLVFSAMPKDVRYRIDNAHKLYIPYVEIDIPFEALEEIVIGPTCAQNADGKIISLLYEKDIDPNEMKLAKSELFMK